MSTEERKNEEQEYTSQQLIVFKQGDEEFGLLIDQIKEVVLTPQITKMPQTPHYIKGVANIRGNIIAILDLEKKFGLSAPIDEPPASYTLVLESDEFKVGLLVKEVPNTLSISPSDIDQDINVIQDTEESYIQGIVKLDERLIILIDIFKIINENDLNLLAIKKTA